jgi:hypothetical protein
MVKMIRRIARDRIKSLSGFRKLRQHALPSQPEVGAAPSRNAMAPLGEMWRPQPKIVERDH